MRDLRIMFETIKNLIPIYGFKLKGASMKKKLLSILLFSVSAYVHQVQAAEDCNANVKTFCSCEVLAETFYLISFNKIDLNTGEKSRISIVKEYDQKPFFLTSNNDFERCNRYMQNFGECK